MMKKMMVVMALILIGGTNLFSQDKKENVAEIKYKDYPIAIFSFSERGEGVKGMGGQVADLLFAKLSANLEKTGLWLMERDELKKSESEMELSLSGDPKEALQAGQLIGAKIIVTGSIFKVGDKNETYIVGKIIGTETSRVLGASINGQEGIDKLTEKLASEIETKILNSSDKLVAKIKDKKEVIEEIRKSIGDKKKPVVFISVDEKHIGQPTNDPAAQTELKFICKELGFEVTEKENLADIIIKGEGFSEFATRRGNLVSIKARLEVKALDKNNSVVAIDRQTAVVVDLAEQIAGKKALQEAASEIAARILPKIVK